jgi:hypothetical protein
MTVSRQKLVEQAIRFGFPERVPIVFWNRDQKQWDIMLYHLALSEEDYRACAQAFRQLGCAQQCS